MHFLEHDSIRRTKGRLKVATKLRFHPLMALMWKARIDQYDKRPVINTHCTRRSKSANFEIAAKDRPTSAVSEEDPPYTQVMVGVGTVHKFAAENCNKFRILVNN